VCFVVLHSSQDHLGIGTRDLDHPISCRCKKQVNKTDAIGTKAESPPLNDLDHAKDIAVDRGKRVSEQWLCIGNSLAHKLGLILHPPPIDGQ
jgi:hypothetical protein